MGMVLGPGPCGAALCPASRARSRAAPMCPVGGHRPAPPPPGRCTQVGAARGLSVWLGGWLARSVRVGKGAHRSREQRVGRPQLPHGHVGPRVLRQHHGAPGAGRGVALAGGGALGLKHERALAALLKQRQPQAHRAVGGAVHEARAALGRAARVGGREGRRIRQLAPRGGGRGRRTGFARVWMRAGVRTLPSQPPTLDPEHARTPPPSGNLTCSSALMADTGSSASSTARSTRTA
jgi:hypothetical protein